MTSGNLAKHLDPLKPRTKGPDNTLMLFAQKHIESYVGLAQRRPFPMIMIHTCTAAAACFLSCDNTWILPNVHACVLLLWTCCGTHACAMPLPTLFNCQVAQLTAYASQHPACASWSCSHCQEHKEVTLREARARSRTSPLHRRQPASQSFCYVMSAWHLLPPPSVFESPSVVPPAIHGKHGGGFAGG